MARSLRWQLHFVSLNGTDCYVNIYTEGGGGVTQLQGADNPFVIDEDDTEDLLEVVRMKTGYLRVVESTYGELDDLHPLTNTSHYVEAVYANGVVFTGFMQAQSFEVPYSPGPRVLEFPVVSPLGLIYGLHFNSINYPDYITLASVLKQAADIMDANIDSIVFPDYMMGSQTTLSLMVNTLSICPFNTDYVPGGSEPLYSPKTIGEFIEDVCHCFGLIVHDMPNCLVFARYDYLGTYNQYDVSTMDLFSPTYRAIASGATVYPMTSLPSRSANGKTKTIMPVSKLTIDYSSDIYPDYHLPFERARVNVRRWFWVVLQPMTDEITGPYLTYNAMPINGSNTVALCAFNGKDKFSPFDNVVAFSFADGADHSTKEIITWKLYDVPKYYGEGCYLSFSIVQVFANTDTSDVFYHTTKAPGAKISVILRNGSYKMNENRVWVIQAATDVIELTADDEGRVTLPLRQPIPDKSSPLEITFRYGELENQNMWGFVNITIERMSSALDSYLGGDTNDKRVLTSDNGSELETSFTQHITVARLAEDILLNQDGTPALNTLVCRYDYMFTTQFRLTFDTSFVNSVIYYLNKSDIGGGAKKRITGLGFNLWNDTTRLSAQGDSSL